MARPGATAAAAWWRAALLLGVVVGLDQASKALVRSHVDLGSRDPIFPAVTLVHTKNRGVAFGVLEGQAALVAVVIGVALVVLLWFFARNAAKAGMWAPVGLLAGGALGNVIDRVAFGEVTDFLKLPAWPAFNVADMAITFGVLGLIVVTELDERRHGPDRSS